MLLKCNSEQLAHPTSDLRNFAGWLSFVCSGVLVTSASACAPESTDLLLGRAEQPLLAQVGPLDGQPAGGGFPSWFRDTNGIRLGLCVDAGDPLCIAAPVPNPRAPIAFPGNFPDEAFWWSADALLTTANGGDAQLVLALEAAFVNEVPAAGDQIAFGRIRLRIDNLPVGSYVITHPFGVDEFEVTAATANIRRSINETQDIGNLLGGSFEPVLGGRIGPFLVWDDASELPSGYLGDPRVAHTVVGSPFGTNFFQIEGPSGAFTGSPDLCVDPAGAVRNDCIRGASFFVQAKLAPNAGLEIVQALYTDNPRGQFVDVFARSEASQELVLSSLSIGDTPFEEDGGGDYFARMTYQGIRPADLEVINFSDTPPTRRRVELLVDEVHVSSASYDTATRRLVVAALSADANATLRLDRLTPTVVAGNAGAPFTFTVENVRVPPRVVSVSSSAGGSSSATVILKPGLFNSAAAAGTQGPELAPIAVIR